jgi:CcmD family protein
MKRLLTILLILNLPNLYAQEVDMADTMRANGKIYVVVAIVLVVLIGLIAYLFIMDRRVSRIEKKLSDRK